MLTGPIFSADPKTLGKGVSVPDACFKIMVDETEGKIRTQAFIVPQSAAQGAGLNRYLVSIDEIERQTQLDFLSGLSDEIEKQVEGKAATRPW